MPPPTRNTQHRSRLKGGNPFHGRGNRSGSPRTRAVQESSRSNIRRAQSSRRGMKFPRK